MKMALIQMSMNADITINLATSLRRIHTAASKGADCILFPEIHLNRFFPQYPRNTSRPHGLSLDDPIIRSLQEVARTLGVVLFPNVYLSQSGQHYDATPVIASDGVLLGVSKMVHIVQTPLFYEQDYYDPSDSGFHVYDTKFGRIGVVICFDRHFPESIRCCALQGAQLIVIPTANTQGEPMELYEWELSVQAMQNGVYIAMCNRVGTEDKMTFCGESLIVGPEGRRIAKAGAQEQIIMGELDLNAVSTEPTSRRYFALRQVHHYGPLTQR